MHSTFWPRSVSRGAVPNVARWLMPQPAVTRATLLRTVGVNVVLAQTVNTCMATVYDTPVLTVRSIIGRGDGLMSGTRYYRDEMEAVLTLGASGSARAQAVGGPRRPASSRPSDRDRGDTGLASSPL